MIIGAYAFPTFGKKRSEAGEGLYRILADASAFAERPLDMLIAPEFTNLTIEEVLGLAQIDHSVLVIPGSSMVRERDSVHNRAYVLKDGRIIHTYDKKFFRTSGGLYDFHYLADKAGRPVLQKGRTSGAFWVGGVRYGLEICADHERKALMSEGVTGLDYQIIIGTGVVIGPKGSIATKRTGTVIAVDGGVDDPQNPIHPNAAVESAGRIVAPQRIVRIGASARRDDLLYIFQS